MQRCKKTTSWSNFAEIRDLDARSRLSPPRGASHLDSHVGWAMSQLVCPDEAWRKGTGAASQNAVHSKGTIHLLIVLKELPFLIFSILSWRIWAAYYLPTVFFYHCKAMSNNNSHIYAICFSYMEQHFPLSSWSVFTCAEGSMLREFKNGGRKKSISSVNLWSLDLRWLP